MTTLVRQICRKHHLYERSSEAHLTQDLSAPQPASKQSAARKPPISVRPEPLQSSLFATS